MSKKSLIAIAIIFVLGIGVFVGYTNYTNTKDSNAEGPIVASNEKDEEGNYTDTEGMTDIEIEQMKAVEVFNIVMNTIWNVPDTKDEVAMADVRSVMENNIAKHTGGDLLKKKLEEDFYAKANSIAIKSLDITKVMPSTVRVKGQDQTLDVYLIYYKLEGVVNGTDRMTALNNENVDFATAAMIKAEDGSYKMLDDVVSNISE